jgi:EAL domain-containing protein (putative c-di-GMP-specific phosphodiesterase class I)
MDDGGQSGRRRRDGEALFILSCGNDTALSQAAQDCGWRPTVGDRSNAVDGFIASAASLAVVDARGAVHQGREAVRSIGGTVKANGAALLVLIAAEDRAALSDFYDEGATHFLLEPFSEDELAGAIQFAARHARRVAFGRRPARRGSDDRLDADLRRALDADEIEILFQPQVSTSTGRIEGAEALARWRHPDFGELGADTLFNVAERSSYLPALSAHVQRRALEEAARWPEALARLRLSINITASDISRSGFESQFTQCVDSAGFPRDRLTVEVTETTLIEDLDSAATLLADLRAAGLMTAIDDFGAGYSSLTYLKALPLDYLKIDKKLCEDITGSPRDRIVVASVIHMASALGLGVIAEGVESQEQLDLLAREGCTLYQGYLCAPPVSSAALAALVSPN